MKVILFTGLSASGKSTLAKSVAEKLGLPIINLHEIGQMIALEKGFSRTREWVAGVGIKQAVEESGDCLVLAIDGKDENMVIVDEVLDPGTRDRLADRYGRENVFVVDIRTNRHWRKRWCISRADNLEPALAIKEMRESDYLKWKAGIYEIIKEANVSLENIESVAEMTEKISCFLGSELLERDFKRGIEK